MLYPQGLLALVNTLKDVGDCFISQDASYLNSYGFVGVPGKRIVPADEYSGLAFPAD